MFLDLSNYFGEYQHIQINDQIGWLQAKMLRSGFMQIQVSLKSKSIHMSLMDVMSVL